MKNIIYLFIIGITFSSCASLSTDGTLFRHGDMKYTIRIDQEKIKVLKYSVTTLSKIN